MLEKIKNGYKWFDKKTGEIHREVFEWYGFKFFLVIFIYFSSINALEIEDVTAKYLIQFIGFLFLYLLFAPPIKNYKQYEGDNRFVRLLDTIERVVLQINEIMFQGFTFKLIIAMTFAAGYIGTVDFDYFPVYFITLIVIYYILALLFSKPKNRENKVGHH